ncbi:chaplin family protein [Streptomyces sp. NPDC051219]|uniref:chaplin family protein n=1 Tax=Streptomyces sp. NPDC051219 TaxID=3155283 RepID=UPI0034392A0A
MRQVTRKGLITMAAASGVIAIGGGYAQADSVANGGSSNSPGVLSGNTVQAPVHVPVNACGNTVNVIGLLNPTIGNRCANTSDGEHGEHGEDGGGATAEGGAANSPGVGSGNHVQAPIDVPVNACGNTVDVVGVLNPAIGNKCHNDSRTSTPPGGYPENPAPENPSNPGNPSNPTNPTAPGDGKPGDEKPDDEKPGEPKPGTPQGSDVPSGNGTPGGSLAETGAGSLGVVIPAAAGLLLGGAVLYRRARSAA